MREHSVLTEHFLKVLIEHVLFRSDKTFKIQVHFEMIPGTF